MKNGKTHCCLFDIGQTECGEYAVMSMCHKIVLTVVVAYQYVVNLLTLPLPEFSLFVDNLSGVISCQLLLIFKMYLISNSFGSC